jgi:dTDP-4-amino-4,6-dideoxygalactose transaminase
MAVHQIGLPCDLEAILGIASRRKLPVVEDAACAIGSELLINGEWQRIGRPHGGIACFSFHPRKVITTGDGGMITTASPDYDRQFRLLRQHGMSVSAADRHQATTVVREEYPVLGYNHRMTDIQAAVGREQLKRLPALLSRRRELGNRYSAVLRELPGLLPPHIPDYARTNYQSYAVWVTEECPRSRDELMQALLEVGVSTRPGVMNAHQEGAYADKLAVCLPVSEAAAEQVLLLPLYDALTDDDQDRVVTELARLARGQ